MPRPALLALLRVVAHLTLATARSSVVMVATIPVSFWFLPANALAYCRTRGCDSKTEVCPRDLRGCLTRGSLLYWADGEAELLVDSSGSALRNLSAADAELALTAAVESWTSVMCPDGQPLVLSVDVAGVVAAAQHGEMDSVLRFEDQDWPYADTALALTTAGYDALGVITHADINVNSAQYSFALAAGDTSNADLQAVLTHEVGHFLGLDHSDVPGATMQPEVMGFGSEDLRSLETDDIEGICAIYGQHNLPESPEASHPDKGALACSAVASNQSKSPFAILGFSVALCLLGTVRRTRGRSPRRLR